MKALVLPSALFPLLGLLLWLPALVDASPPPADSLHYLLPFDYEQWQGKRPAKKRVANLDIGEPRTVRMIYFLPNDRPYQAGVVDSMKTTIRQLQTFYAEQMQAHGYGEKSFRFETDDQGEPLVHLLAGQQPDSHYLRDPFWSVSEEIEQVFDLAENIYFVVIDNSRHAIGIQVGGVASSTGKTGGLGLVHEEFDFSIVAHELTHAFGLTWHDHRDDAYVLSYGFNPDRLSPCSAEFLSVHPYFNPDVDAQAGRPPTIELLSPRLYPEGSGSINVQLALSDPEGLHQVTLLVKPLGLFIRPAGEDLLRSFDEVKACLGLAGEKEAVVEFDYDGVIPSNPLTNLNLFPLHSVRVAAVDSDGNVGWTSFDLLKISKQHIATLYGVSAVRSVLFSPDGATLASATDDGLEIWDVATRQNLALLKQTSEVRSVAFSSDGSKLASGSTDGTIELWENSIWSNIATLESQDSIFSLAFSPDGATIASGTGEKVELWDVESGANTTTFEGHTGRVSSISFSQDGTLLASGSEDGTVRLWDVAAGAHITALEGHTGRVSSVSFSQDGTLLASGSEDGTVKLWDASSQTNSATLSKHQGGVTSVAFSPDAATLASGSKDNTIKLFDVLTKENVLTLSGHTGEVTSVAFSPDGATLASGSLDHTINLWDASERLLPRPRMLVKISGDNQEGTPGSGLANPFVVEVRDQYDNPLKGIQVAFSIKSGGGMLGGRSTAEEVATTNSEGRTQSVLTLGLNPGKNSVEATVRGLEPVTFRSVGVGTPGTLGESDYQTWHLPDGAIARFGKGRISQGEKAIAFSPGGRRLALVSSLGIWVYDVATFRPQALLPTGFNRFGSLAFSPDGTILASSPADGDRLTKVWDLATGGIITFMEGHTASPPVFSPDGNTLATGLWDGTVKLWDVATGETVATLEGHADVVTAVDFAPNGLTLASGSGDHTLRLWDLGTGETTAIFEGHTHRVLSIAFSPNGTVLASGSWDGTLRLWDVATGTNTAILERLGVPIESVAFSADGTMLASKSENFKIKLWDVASETNTAILGGHTRGVSSLAFSSDGTLASGSWADGTVRLWYLTTGNAATLEGHADGVQSLAFSPDGKLIASGSASYEYSIRLWEVGTGLNTLYLEGHKWLVEALAFSPDGTTLASASWDRTVKLWDMTTGINTATLQGHTDWVRSVAFSSDGTLVTGSKDRTIKLWDLATGTNTATLEGHTGGINSVSFSPDPSTLASGSEDGTVKLWDLETRSNTVTFQGHTNEVLSVAFSPDGTILASGAGANDHSVRLWDVALGKPAGILRGHANWVNSVAFSPDGTILASGADDGTVRIWNPRRGDHTATLEHTSWVEAVAFSPDGTILASALEDGTIQLWDLRLVLPHPRTLTKLSGDEQQGLLNSQLDMPFIVEVKDQNGDVFEGAQVTFAVTSGGGTISTVTATTDSRGSASTTLTLGRGSGTNTVEVTVADLDPVTFSSVAEATPDFDGDGVTNFADFFLFADAFGSTDARFDLDGSGVVDFGDFFIFADAFGQPARAKLLALAAKLIGLPEGPQLQQNAPNPFNSQTVISYFMLAPSPARLEVFALTGQRVAILLQGPQQAGLHRLHWDGRDGEGRPLASGIYLYRLVTAEGALTRKLVLLR